MKLLKQFCTLLIVGLLVSACGAHSIENKKSKKEAPVRIANDSLAYEIIIIDPGFTAYLNAVALPEGLLQSKRYLEARNRVWVTTMESKSSKSEGISSRYL